MLMALFTSYFVLASFMFYTMMDFSDGDETTIWNTVLAGMILSLLWPITLFFLLTCVVFHNCSKLLKRK